MDKSICKVRNFDDDRKHQHSFYFNSKITFRFGAKRERKNALSLEDFKNRKIVVGDEAHHYNANTQSQTQLFQSWEKLIEAIHQADLNNILLEFTATLD
jgi:type III restriction enzyme